MEKTVGGNTDNFFFNESWQILEVRRNGDSDPIEQYVWDASYIDTPVVRFYDHDVDGVISSDSPGGTFYYLWDANHNITSIFQDGASVDQIEERYVYEPYGEVTIYDRDWTSTALRNTSDFANSIMFAGYYRDGETGLALARSRYLNSSTGTWGQRDFGGYIDGMGLYEYVRGGPTLYLDPTGTQSEDPRTLSEIREHVKELNRRKDHDFMNPKRPNSAWLYNEIQRWTEISKSACDPGSRYGWIASGIYMTTTNLMNPDEIDKMLKIGDTTLTVLKSVPKVGGAGYSRSGLSKISDPEKMKKIAEMYSESRFAWVKIQCGVCACGEDGIWRMQDSGKARWHKLDFGDALMGDFANIADNRAIADAILKIKKEVCQATI